MSTLRAKRVVQVYRNLHKKCYSVRCKRTGLVIDHVDHINLKNCRLVVGQKGRQRVLRDKRKNVHAFIEGEISDFAPHQEDMGELYYNPYLVSHWTDKHDDNCKVASCKTVTLTSRGVFYE